MAEVTGDGPQGFLLLVHQPGGHVVANVVEADAADSGPLANPLDQPAPLGVRFAGLGVREDPFRVSLLFPQAPEGVIELRPHVKQVKLHGPVFPLSGPEADGLG